VHPFSIDNLANFHYNLPVVLLFCPKSCSPHTKIPFYLRQYVTTWFQAIAQEISTHILNEKCPFQTYHKSLITTILHYLHGCTTLDGVQCPYPFKANQLLEMQIQFQSPPPPPPPPPLIIMAICMARLSRSRFNITKHDAIINQLGSICFPSFKSAYRLI